MLLMNFNIYFPAGAVIRNIEFDKVWSIEKAYDDIQRFPVDTGRKMNVHKTFRRRLGRLLNVLCTLNLFLLSTGNIG